MDSHAFIPDNLFDDIHDSRYYTPLEFNNTISHNPDNISLLHLNSRSLSKNFEHFENLLHSINNFTFSIIGITETWLHENSPDLFNLPNYKLLRADRKGRRGGGVAFYISQELKFKMRSDIKLTQVESLFIEIENKNLKNIVVGLIYRPPDSNLDPFCEELEQYLHKLGDENKHMFLLGDFNINFLSFSRNNNSAKFMELMYSHSFNSFINNPTRINPHSSTQIDNIFSNVHNNKTIGGLLCSEVSDHLPIFLICECKLYPKSSDNSFYRKESAHNINLLKQDLLSERWTDVCNTNNVNIAYKHFNDKLQYYYDKNIPICKVKNKRNKPKNPWITKGILKSIQTRNRLFKQHLRNPTDANLKAYRTYRNKLTKLIRTSRKLYFSDKINKAGSNTNATWKVIKEVMGTKTDPPPTDNITLNGTKIDQPNQCANSFNSFFTNIGPELARKITSPDTHFTNYLSKRTKYFFFLNPTNPTEIINITQSLKTSKSQGFDRISTFMLKEIIHPLTKPLTHIFNNSLSQGVFPDLLKIAKVNPIFKKDNPHEISNYRPISILPSLSKVLEKIVYDRLYKFLDKYNILNSNQYGFRKKYSTDLALIKIYDKISSAIANKEHVIGIFMDLSKAFDTLNHAILLSKLKNYGVRGHALLWFENYLKNRKQYVTFNGHNSHSQFVQCGVPQGSILGPLLFLLYVNDIFNTSSLLSFVLFADDTNIFCSHKDFDSLIDILNFEINKVSNWFKSNKLSLNITKTHSMYFKLHSHNNDIPLNIKIDDILIEQKDSSKFLGVIIDEKLTWNEHLHHIIMCISRSIGIISKLRFLLPQSTLFTLYNALILPYISYCNIVWANCGSTKINSIFLLQKRALRICTGSHYLAHTDPLFHKFKTLKISDLNSVQVAIVMFKYINKQLPPSFDSMFNFNNTVHSYPTRISGNFHLTNPKLSFSHRSIRHLGPDLWNNFSENIKSCTTLYSFKATLKRNLIETYCPNP